jgi:hypothetical protein
MHEGARIGDNEIEKGKWIKKWVRKVVDPPPLADPINEKDTYAQARTKISDIEWITSTSTIPRVNDITPIYDMPPVYDHSEKK